MHVIRVEDVALQHAGKPIFEGVSWSIGDRDRIGLVGPNGSGKSSLLRAIVGELGVDRGSIHRQRGISIAYLPQEVELEAERTLLECASALPPKLAAVEAELAACERRLADPKVASDEGKLERALERQERALEQWERLGGERHRGRVRELLAKLGLAGADEALPTAALSGGQKKLVALTRLALEGPDVLLLDEPDNHLDLEAKAYLEAFVRGYEGAVVIVSHDRYLLDETVGRIAELEDGRLTLYRGTYSSYVNERELGRLRQQQRYAAQQKEIARIEAAIARFELWASMVVNERHIKQARHRRRMLERMEERGEIVEKVRERRRMGLAIEGWRGSDQALEIEGLRIGFDGAPVLDGVDLLVRHGERVGLIGPNGAGKSLLLRLVLGELEPMGGTIRVGPSTQIGYYAQEHQTLEAWLDRTPLALVRDTSPMTEGEAVAFLLRFLFSYEQVQRPVHTLSGGERSRLQFACLVLERPNLLLLDEPTNNLDIPSAEVLERALDEFEGAILVISHDRYLLDRVVDRVLVLEAGRLAGYPGGYSDYLERRAAGA